MKALGKRVTVLGLGKSGFEGALFLHAQRYEVFVSEKTQTQETLERAEVLKKRGIRFEIGSHSLERILASDWILISPGIGPQTPIYRAVKGQGLPIFSEIEAASWFCPSSQVVAVTGSAGKTTVSTLLGRIFQKAKGRAVCCGNIGNPWIGELARIQKDDFVVLEISSFQLVHCQSFRPKVAVLLNLAPNHQDWHQTMNEYVRAKLRIFQNQTQEDIALLRRRDQSQWFPDFSFRAQTVYFDEPVFPLTPPSARLARLAPRAERASGGLPSPPIPATWPELGERPPALRAERLGEVGVRGCPNPNEAVLYRVAELFDIPHSIVQDVLAHFEGIEHRLEKVLVSKGVTYINDSKCTTPHSLAWALEKFKDRQVILIAGGHPKSEDFDTVRSLLSQKVRQAILIGEARPLLEKLWQGACPLTGAGSLEEAVKEAGRLAKDGETVLLSPACASFDMFKNYEERGRLFKRIVLEINSRVYV